MSRRRQSLLKDKRLLKDERGATMLEFTLISPLFFLFLMGAFDVGHQIYLSVVINGAAQTAARNSSIEPKNASIAAIDTKLVDQIKVLAPNAQVVPKRLNYFSYNDVHQPEVYGDTNANNVCDNGEIFEDKNQNGMWDADVGKAGEGGARDVVELEILVSYKRLFPLWKMIGISETATITSRTILKNQPYASQSARPTQALQCT